MHQVQLTLPRRNASQTCLKRQRSQMLQPVHLQHLKSVEHHLQPTKQHAREPKMSNNKNKKLARQLLLNKLKCNTETTTDQNHRHDELSLHQGKQAIRSQVLPGHYRQTQPLRPPMLTCCAFRLPQPPRSWATTFRISLHCALAHGAFTTSAIHAGRMQCSLRSAATPSSQHGAPRMLRMEAA